MFVSYFHIRLCLCRISISDYVCVVYPYQIMFLSFNNNTTDVTNGTGTAKHTEAREFTPDF